MKARIKFYLAIRSVTQRDIACALGLSEAFISQVINGKRQSRRVQNYIAQVTGVKREELFGRKAA